MNLFLIRHGQSVHNITPIDDLANLDTGLTELGITQVEALRDYYAERNITADAFYTSTMRRTKETANILAAVFGTPIEDDRLREICDLYPDGTVVPADAMPREWIADWVHLAPFKPRAIQTPPIESWMQFRARIGVFVDELCEKHVNEDVYVVAHGGVIAAACENILNLGPYRRTDIHSHNSAWTHFSYRPDAKNVEAWSLRGQNRVDHLVLKGLL
ncbi:MAG: histidine phosphatase family protein [Chloroflexota bacterium]